MGAAEFPADLRAAGPGPDVLRSNSAGGDGFEGFARAEAVRQHSNVVAVVDGLAASIASVIGCPRPGRSWPSPAFLMVHDALTTTVGNRIGQRVNRLDHPRPRRHQRADRAPP